MCCGVIELFCGFYSFNKCYDCFVRYIVLILFIKIFYVFFSWCSLVFKVMMVYCMRVYCFMGMYDVLGE